MRQLLFDVGSQVPDLGLEGRAWIQGCGLISSTTLPECGLLTMIEHCVAWGIVRRASGVRNIMLQRQDRSPTTGYPEQMTQDTCLFQSCA